MVGEIEINMNDIMLDLETMSLASNAAIVSIGAVQFDLKEGKLGAEYYRNIDLASSVEYGLDMDPNTVMWWMQQGDEARAALAGGTLDLRSALRNFNDWLDSLQIPWGERRIWGNGAAYDNVVMKNAYKANQDATFRDLTSPFITWK